MTPSPGPWTDPAWRSAIEGWAADRLAGLGRRVTGPIEQPHVRPWSTVLRIPTDRGPAWCKAAGRGTAHEARLLPALAAWDTPHLVRPLASDADRSWLLFDDGGLTLRETRPDGRGDLDLDAWEAVLAAYARLQRSVERHADDLLALGVPDGRPAALPATLARLVDADRWWELVGPDDRSPTRAARARLRDLAPHLAAEAAELDASGIPATIQHDDVHGGNVFVGEAGIRLFDWGDSVVAHPFGSMVTTLNSVAHHSGSDPDGPELRRLRDAYLDAWTDIAPRPVLHTVLDRALDLGRIGKAAAWARSLDDVEPAAMEGHGEAPALWLLDLVERVDRRAVG